MHLNAEQIKASSGKGNAYFLGMKKQSQYRRPNCAAFPAEPTLLASLVSSNQI